MWSDTNGAQEQHAWSGACGVVPRRRAVAIRHGMDLSVGSWTEEYVGIKGKVLLSSPVRMGNFMVTELRWDSDFHFKINTKQKNFDSKR